jgi:hypothetical protein
MRRSSTAYRPLARLILLVSAGLACWGCSLGQQSADLSRLYDRAAQYHGVERDPIILIPGILGSKLTHAPSDTTVWGAFTGKHADPETPRGARLAALPMEPGTPLSGLRDSVRNA